MPQPVPVETSQYTEHIQVEELLLTAAPLLKTENINNTVDGLPFFVKQLGQPQFTAHERLSSCPPYWSMQDPYHLINLVTGVIERNRGTYRCFKAKTPQNRLDAVMTRAHRDPSSLSALPTSSVAY